MHPAAPRVDGKVPIDDFGAYVQAGKLVPTTIYRTEITEGRNYDVVARIID